MPSGPGEGVNLSGQQPFSVEKQPHPSMFSPRAVVKSSGQQPNLVYSQPQPLLSGPSEGEMLSGQQPGGGFRLMGNLTKLRIEAASLLVRSVRRVHQVIAAAPLCILARSGIVAALKVCPLGSCQAVRAAAVLCEGAVLIQLPILIRTTSKLRAWVG